MVILDIVRVIGATVVKEIKCSRMNMVLKILSGVVRILAIAWLAGAGKTTGAVTYLAFGAALMMIWHEVVATGGWAFDDEIGAGTLDFSFISKTPFSVVIIGKVMANVIKELPVGAFSALAVFLVSASLPQAVRVSPLIISFILAVVGIVSIGFFFCMLIVLVGGRAGFFMGILPFGTTLGGFILPIYQLPQAIRIMSMCVPSSWATKSLWLAITGGGIGEIVINWAVSIALCIAWFCISLKLCGLGERRLKVNGDLSRQW